MIARLPVSCASRGTPCTLAVAAIASLTTALGVCGYLRIALGVTGVEAPSTCPPALSACTAMYRGVLERAIAVSKPLRGAKATGASACGLAPREQAPLHYRCGAVPAGVGDEPSMRPGANCKRRPLRGRSGPGELAAPCRTGRARADGRRRGAGRRGVFREERFLAPADEPVAAGQRLEVALAGGQQRRGVDEARDERRGHRLPVEREHGHARLRVHAAACRRCRRTRSCRRALRGRRAARPGPRPGPWRRFECLPPRRQAIWPVRASTS